MEVVKFFTEEVVSTDTEKLKELMDLKESLREDLELDKNYPRETDYVQLIERHTFAGTDLKYYSLVGQFVVTDPACSDINVMNLNDWNVKVHWFDVNIPELDNSFREDGFVIEKMSNSLFERGKDLLLLEYKQLFDIKNESFVDSSIVKVDTKYKQGLFEELQSHFGKIENMEQYGEMFKNSTIISHSLEYNQHISDQINNYHNMPNN